MAQQNAQQMKKILKFLASLKLAVFVILSFAALAAIGTIVESKYDARAAQLLVYHTWWMYAVMALLSINLIAVMVDRWPWQVRHVGFVCAHIGILILLMGSIITKQFGVDGTMQFAIGERNQQVIVPDTEVVVFSSFTGDSFTRVFSKPVNFFLDSPKDNPIKIPISGGEIEIVDYMKYATAAEKFIASNEDRDGAAVRFQIKNANVNLNEWLLQKNKAAVAVKSLGPANVYLGDAPIGGEAENAIVLLPQTDGSLKYEVRYKSGKPSLKGKLLETEVVQTGWMGLEFKVLRYLPKAKRSWDFKQHDRPNANTTQAIKVKFQGKEEWLQLNDILRLFAEDAAYVFRYSQQMVDIGEPLALKKFNIGRYQGTMRAMAYESLVDVPGLGEHLISMNEPLKFKGYTFYQASFTEDEMGRPNSSVLSVNYDPGRWIKYLGSLVMCFGIVHLFWFKRRQAKGK